MTYTDKDIRKNDIRFMDHKFKNAFDSNSISIDPDIDKSIDR